MRPEYPVPELYPPRKQCFGYQPAAKRCRRLHEMLCATKGKCSLYKTHDEYQDQAAATFARAAAKGYYATGSYQPMGGGRYDPKTP